MQGRTVIVTGAGGALGAAVALAAHQRGAYVAAVDLVAVKAPASERWLSLGDVDLTNFESARAAMEQINSTTGRIDALLNIAGGFRWQTLQDGALETWDTLYNLNLKTAATASKSALPYLSANEGAIVNIGALGAMKAGAGMGAYAASKAGVAKLTESLAEELKGQVRVNAVLPSIIDTPANRRDMPNADFSTWVAPADLAAVMLFLASSEARAVTGALVPVTGKV